MKLVCDQERVRRRVFVVRPEIPASSLVSIGKSDLQRIVWTLVDFSIKEDK
jgi:hypothetical protein